MKDRAVFAVTLLDFVLILMTATWIIVNLAQNTILELSYNVIYVIINITTLILNIRILNKTYSVV